MSTASAAAPIVYGAGTPFVNANISSPSFSLYGAALAVGVTLDQFAGFIYHAICEKERKEIPRSVMVVLAAYLKHGNKGHNRAYASIACVRDDINATRAKPMAQSTVEIAFKILREQGILRPLWEEELHAGDGPHNSQFRGIKRKGRFPVNTYDIAGLWQFITGWFRALLARGAAALRVLVPTRPRNNIKQAAKGSRANVSNVGTDTDNPENQDLFWNPFPPTATEHGADEHGEAPVKSSKRSDSFSPVYDVGKQINSGEASVRVAPRPVQKKIPSKAKRLSVPTVKNRDSYSGSANMLARLRGLGIRGAVPGQIVQTMGAEWTAKLVRFALWRQRSGESCEPGYLVGVWKNHRDQGDFHGWEEGFERAERLAGSATVAPTPLAVRQSALVRVVLPPVLLGDGKALREKIRRKREGA